MNTCFIRHDYKILFLLLLVITYTCSNENFINQRNSYNPVGRPLGYFLNDSTFELTPSANFVIGRVRLWTPSNKSELKAILILMNHNNSNGLTLANRDFWQNFATENQIALVGVHFHSDENGQGYYANAADGSGYALLRAIDTLAIKNQIPHLLGKPYLLRGYSAGGVFSYNFASLYPEKTLAFANIRGGNIDTYSNAQKVSGLFLMGVRDIEARNTRIREAFHKNREMGAKWAIAVQKDVGHFGDMIEVDEFISKYFSNILDAEIISDGIIENVLLEDGWLGNNENLEFHTYTSYMQDKKKASWLINQSMANDWYFFQQ